MVQMPWLSTLWEWTRSEVQRLFKNKRREGQLILPVAEPPPPPLVSPQPPPGEGVRFGPDEPLKSPHDIQPPAQIEPPQIEPTAPAPEEPTERPQEAPPQDPPAQLQEPSQEPPDQAQEPSEPQPAPLNRQQRRAAARQERQRRKFDQWAKPQGELPHHPPRGPRKEPAKPSQGQAPQEEEELIDGMFLPSEFYGEFNFRDSILSQLDRYWVYLARMKLRDPDAYGFYKELGAIIVPHTTIHLCGDDSESDKELGRYQFTEEDKERLRRGTVLPPWFKENRPSFGCVVYGANKRVEDRELAASEKGGFRLWIPKFMYYTKYAKPPPDIQPVTGGDVYKMTVWWDRPHDPEYKKKGGTPTDFAVFISQDGREIKVLKMIDTEFVPVRHKTRGSDHKRGKMFRIPKRAWHIPTEFERWSKSHGLDPQLHLGHLFCEALKFHEWTNYSMVRVAVHKEDLTAVFGVNIRRMSYFFRDRDIEVGPSGYRKKVFHIVRAHERHYKSGKVVPIKLQFRGEKEFDWAGYHVKITVPGLDHFVLSEVDIDIESDYWRDESKDYFTEPEFGKSLTDLMDHGYGGAKR